VVDKGMNGRYHALDASEAIRSKISLTNELRMAMALLEIPVSGWTCLRTATRRQRCHPTRHRRQHTHPCRCRKSRSPCGPSCASSSRRQRRARPTSWSRSSCQPWRPRSVELGQQRPRSEWTSAHLGGGFASSRGGGFSSGGCGLQDTVRTGMGRYEWQTNFGSHWSCWSVGEEG
jgi:uncharacterized membrane protein YgcG